MKGFKLVLVLSCIVLTSINIVNAQIYTAIQRDAILVANATTDAQVNSLGIGNKQTTVIYLDGLGRSVQQVANSASPNASNDIVQPIVYNAIGQQDTNYLPYVDNTNNYSSGAFRSTAVTDQTNYYNNSGGSINKVASDANPYSQKLFENSPLRRVLQDGSVGNGFQPNQHSKIFNYRTNNSADKVLMWDKSGNYQNQYYTPNSLAVSSITGEDGQTTLNFNDMLGQTILQRKVLSTTQNLDTYTIFSAGKSVYVIPPKAVALMTSGQNYSLSQAGVNNLIYRYYYDGLGRLVEKDIPGSGPVYFIYDPLNRVVLIQDGNLRISNQWNYIKYDAEDRPISQGIYTDLNSNHIGGVNGQMQAYVKSLTSYATYTFETRNGGGASYYSNNCFPTANYDNSNLQDLAYTYYDDYFLTQGTNPDFSYKSQGLPGEASSNATTSNTRGLPTMYRKRSVGLGLSNIWFINVIFYDARGNSIQTQSNNQLSTSNGGISVTDYKTNVVDFVGKPLINLTKRAAGAAGTTTVKTTLTYDSHNIRLLYVDQVYNSQAAIRIASYEYNELGQLVKKNLEPVNAASSSIPATINLGPSNSVASNSVTSIFATTSIQMSPGPAGSSGSAASFVIPSGANFRAFISNGALQSVDYRYNIRGQITSINNSTLTNDNGNTNSDSNDLFGMQIMYDQPDSKLNTDVAAATASFSGRVSAIKWMTVNGSLAKLNERSYIYNYDQVNRITSANYSERSASSPNTTAFGINKGGFDEYGIVYDENGNILNLSRNSSTINASSNSQIDALVYRYNSTDPNQLLNVNDNNNSTNAQYTSLGFQNITGSSSNYTYTANDNLQSDPYKGLQLGYNILNKIDNIQNVTGVNGAAVTGRYINYTYDASGMLIRKQQYDRVNNTPTLTTTDYIDGFVYLNQALSYFSMNEGRVVNSGGNLNPEFIIADQQGNARFSFQDNGSGQVKVIQENSYYAFGSVMANSPISMPTLQNRQLYNGGSEWQNDYSNLPNYYQTSNRNYDPTIGRFISIDPMAELSANMSTFHYAKNNPISFNDPLGNDPPGSGDPGEGDPGDTGVLGQYAGYNSQAESQGSSNAGTNEGGSNGQNQNSTTGYHNDYAYNESGQIVMTTRVAGGGGDTFTPVFNMFPGIKIQGFAFYTNDLDGLGVGNSDGDTTIPDKVADNYDFSGSKSSSNSSSSSQIQSPLDILFGSTQTIKTGIDYDKLNTPFGIFHLSTYNSVSHSGGEHIFNYDVNTFINQKGSETKFDGNINLFVYKMKFTSEVGVEQEFGTDSWNISTGVSWEKGVTVGAKVNGFGFDLSYKPSAAGLVLIGTAIFVPEALPVVYKAVIP